MLRRVKSLVGNGGARVRVLVVEDDALIARGIVVGLRSHGLTVDSVDTAAQAQMAVTTGHLDALVLDVGLPDLVGTELLRRLRAAGHAVPILLLTAKDAIEDRIAGLQAGADDYMTKPFDLGELAARLHALVRRADGRSINLIEAGPLQLDPASGETWLSGATVALSRRESALLAALMAVDGRCLSGEQLKDSLYGFDQEVGSNALNVHIHNLRRKLGAQVVETVRGIGYRFGGVEP